MWRTRTNKMENGEWKMENGELKIIQLYPTADHLVGSCGFYVVTPRSMKEGYLTENDLSVYIIEINPTMRKGC